MTYRMGKKWSFFKEAVKNIRTTGAIASSSPALAKRLVAALPADRPVNIVELGPGDGSITHAILERIHPGSKVTAFEINPSFVAELANIGDDRLEVLAVGAERLTEYFAPGSVDFVISSLPLSMIPQEVKEEILRQTRIVLGATGQFRQYQYALQDYSLLKDYFHRVSVSYTLANLPPAFVYSCMMGG
ncbi:methyltransferase [Neolewinella lacunae]|uniref:Methyltransferase n=1 Tax=Neolewinella lacunae TaxID=1517758 RepID=A0A923T7R2_9BACT|nr:methyltransferase domain-containing protein [Neolewinella lacunae]MBC6993791.1 methyltransferase [Neolewinella lacunae]MDN3635318.1 methyltransferase [Neolewinella lacunae]